MDKKDYKNKILELENKVLKLNDKAFWAKQELKARNEELEEYLQLVVNKNKALEDKDKKIQTQTLLRKEAEQLSRVKTKFLSTMSHEIRTPMNGVISMTELLNSTNLDDEQKLYVDTIKNSGDILLNVINDILDFSKFESGKLVLEKKKFLISDLFEQSISIFSSLANKKNINLICEIDEKAPERIYSDITRLKQILVNLLSNAFKFTDKGSILLKLELVKYHKEHVYLKFLVKDSGIGIPKEKIDTIFKDFSQVDASTTRKYGGTGLGLAICKSLINIMGSDIKVVSKLNQGSCFSFILKTNFIAHKNFKETIKSTDAAQSKNKIKDLTLEQNSPLKILLVEDNKTNQLIALSILNKLGYTDIKIAIDGGKAVKMVEENYFDIVFMDCQMPVLNGYDATKKIRLLPDITKSNIFIVAMTANALPEDREKCYDSGMNEYLSKPIRVEKLIQIIKKISKDSRFN